MKKYLILMNQKEDKFKINLFLGIYIIYLLFFVISDILNIGRYSLNFENGRFIEQIISLGIITIFLYKLKDRVEFYKIKYDKIFTIFSLIILIIAILRAIIPDLSYDVSAFHILAQNPGFKEVTNSNVFPMSFVFFNLSDKIFYYFRVILGYRMGTLLNALILILIYSQVVEFIKIMCKEKKFEVYKNKLEKIHSSGTVKYMLSVSFWGFVCISTMYIYMDLGTYMVDLCVIPILLELLKILILNEEANTKYEFLFVSLICGLSIAMKLTNVIFIAPILLLYLIKNRKNITINVFIICFIVGIVPILPYMIYSYISTGSPVYFFYNSIFKSSYYTETNFKDIRWGPNTLKEILIWPLHMVLNYKERIAEISKIPYIYPLLGILSSSIISIISIRNKLNNKKIYLTLSGIFMVFTILWLKTTGYPRYAIVCEILSGVITIFLSYELISNKYKIISRIFGAILLCILVVQSIGLTIGAGLNYFDWAWRPKTYELLSYKNDLKYVLNDRGLIGTDEQRNKIDVFFQENTSSALASLVKPDAKMINADYINMWLKDVEYRNYKEVYFDKVKELYNKGENIYTITQVQEYSNIGIYADSKEAYIEEVEFLDGYFTGIQKPLLIKYSFNNKKNTLDFINTEKYYNIDVKSNKEASLRGTLALAPYVIWNVPNTRFIVEATDGKTTKVILDKVINPLTFYKLNEEVDLSEFDDNIKLTVKHVDMQGNFTNWNQLSLINFRAE